MTARKEQPKRRIFFFHTTKTTRVEFYAQGEKHVNLAYLHAVAVAKAVIHVRHGVPRFVGSIRRRRIVVLLLVMS